MIDKKKIFLPLAVVLAGLLAVVLLVQARPDVERAERSAALARALFVEAQPRDVQLQVSSQGTVEARVESDLVAEVSGTVQWTSPDFVAGGFVNAGQTIVRLDVRDYELALKSQAAALAQARVAWEREQAEGEIARREWQELGRGEASPLVMREPQLREAEARVAAAEAAVERAKLDLQRATVVAPFTGRVRSKNIDRGEFVSRGTPLATLYAVDAVEIRLAVPDEELQFLDRGPWRGNRGPLVRLSAEFAGEQVAWQGRIVRTTGEIDAATRLVHLVARVDDPYGLRGGSLTPPLTPPLQVGMFVEANIQGREVDGVVTLPRSALRGETSVLVIDEADRVHTRAVELLRVRGEEVLVAAGLASGERVVISPIDVFVEGMAVRPVPAANPAANALSSDGVGEPLPVVAPPPPSDPGERPAERAGEEEDGAP